MEVLIRKIYEVDPLVCPPQCKQSMRIIAFIEVDPAGNPLNTMMPRWEMSSEDLDSLIEYLKTI